MKTDDNLYDGYIKTISGKEFHLEGDNPDELQLTDIAHALANVARFSGHTDRHYSVAEHCLLVVSILRAWGCDNPLTLLTGLMHDATEAYLPDLPTPFKALMPGYRAYEEQLWTRIAARFGLYERPEDVPHADIVNVVMGTVTAENLGRSLIKHADRTALFIEAKELQPKGESETWPEHEFYGMLAKDWVGKTHPALELRYRVCGPFGAKMAFLREYNTLTAQIAADKQHQQETFYGQS